jgi:hypothetical protein
MNQIHIFVLLILELTISEDNKLDMISDKVWSASPRERPKVDGIFMTLPIRYRTMISISK